MSCSVTNGNRQSGSPTISYGAWKSSSLGQVSGVLLPAPKRCPIVSPRDKSRVVTGDARGMVKLWDAATLTELHSTEYRYGFVKSVAFSPDARRPESNQRRTAPDNPWQLPPHPLPCLFLLPESRLRMAGKESRGRRAARRPNLEGPNRK